MLDTCLKFKIRITRISQEINKNKKIRENDHRKTVRMWYFANPR